VQWVGRAHLFTAEAAGLLIGLAGLVVAWRQYEQSQRDTADERRRVRDRRVMLARVRYRWITGVLEQSLSEQVRIRLGLARRPGVIDQPVMIMRRPAGQPERLPADTPVTPCSTGSAVGCSFSARPGRARPPRC
jgi:hypothetical protein